MNDLLEVFRRLEALETKVASLQLQVSGEVCSCLDDWTDGTAFCSECHKPSRF